MKTLVLVRHGKAEQANYENDKTRKLVEEGYQRTFLVAKNSKEILNNDFKFYSSTGSRAAQTAVVFCEVLKIELQNVTFLDDLYTFNSHDLAATIKSMPNDCDKIVIFGHNGGLTDFVVENTTNFIPEIPTSGLVAMEFETNNWQNLPKGKVIKTIFPNSIQNL